MMKYCIEVPACFALRDIIQLYKAGFPRGRGRLPILFRVAGSRFDGHCCTVTDPISGNLLTCLSYAALHQVTARNDYAARCVMRPRQELAGAGPIGGPLRRGQHGSAQCWNAVACRVWGRLVG